MQFVQKSVFSNSGLSRDLLTLLDSVGESQVKKRFEESKHKDKLVQIFKQIHASKFVDLNEFGDFVPENKIAFLSLEKAIKLLPHFEKLSQFYSTESTKKKKFLALLESLEIIEAVILQRLVLGNYDVEAVKSYLHPPTKVKKEQKAA